MLHRPSFTRALGGGSCLAGVLVLAWVPFGCAPSQVPESGTGAGSEEQLIWEAANDSAGLEGETQVAGAEAAADDGPVLSVTPLELDLGSALESRCLLVRNEGSGSMPFQVTSDVNWVVLEGSQGNSSGDYERVTVYADRDGLPPGTYEGELTVATGEAQVAVALRMTVDEQESGENEPILSVDKEELDFGWLASRASFVLQNIGGGTLNYSITSDVDWAVPYPTSGSNTGTEHVIQVDAVRADLDPGDYVGLITVETEDGQWHYLVLQMTVLLSAASWGFDPLDSTHAIQGVIDSRASRILIPDMGQPWIVQPITLVSDQEIYFEPGALVLAKEGAFHGEWDCLFTAAEVSNVTLWGYGATLRMRKSDYANGEEYEPSERRHCLLLRGCNDVRVYGLSLESSGGDGLYVGPTWDIHRVPSRNIEVRDCICADNYRTGIAVISVENLQIANCVLRNTSGTDPQSGMDLEPDFEQDRLVDVVIQDCTAENNAADGFIVSVRKLTPNSTDVSILFERCRVTSSAKRGFLLCNGEDAPGGLIEFRDCTATGTAHAGAYVAWFNAESTRVHFVDCVWSDLATVPQKRPLEVYMERVPDLNPAGEVAFLNCTVYDSLDRHFIRVGAIGEQEGIYNLVGYVDVFNPFGAGSGWEPPGDHPHLDASYFTDW